MYSILLVVVDVIFGVFALFICNNNHTFFSRIKIINAFMRLVKKTNNISSSSPFAR